MGDTWFSILTQSNLQDWELGKRRHFSLNCLRFKSWAHHLPTRGLSHFTQSLLPSLEGSITPPEVYYPYLRAGSQLLIDGHKKKCNYMYAIPNSNIKQRKEKKKQKDLAGKSFGSSSDDCNPFSKRMLGLKRLLHATAPTQAIYLLTQK